MSVGRRRERDGGVEGYIRHRVLSVEFSSVVRQMPGH
jgi:hypothetical protein